MRFIDCSLPEFVEQTRGKKIICFGAGGIARQMVAEHKNDIWFEKVECFIDNDEFLHNMGFIINERIIPIKSVSYLKSRYENALAKNAPDEIVLLYTCRLSNMKMQNVFEDIESYGNFSELRYYVFLFMLQHNYYDNIPKFVLNARANEPQIPKSIHYIWFGGKPIPEHLQKYIDSWSKFCPDYEIKLWNENNYDITKNKYCKNMYELGKFAYASDYARLDIIYQYGGIYLDTDVELVKKIDELLYYKAFFSLNFTEIGESVVATGAGFGGVKHCPIIKENLDEYNNVTEKEFNNICIDFTHNAFRKHKEFAIVENKDVFSVIDGYAILFPNEFFHPFDIFHRGKITEKTFAIHHSEFSYAKEFREHCKKIEKRLKNDQENEK